ncbi:MAG: CoA transferase [Hyphomicrobiaceae bacterium]
MPTSEAPLAGIVVLDLGQIYQGSYAGFLAAKAGAQVIKVEPPQGEPLRRRAEISGGSVPFAMLNCNKLGVTLDLKSERGRSVLAKMVGRADALIENFAPGVMDRLGVGYERLSAINPRLVYVSGSGYGLTGPDRDNLAMDLTVQAYSGLMSITGYPDRPPVKAGGAVVDFLGGTHLYGALTTALFQRERTGAGRKVEVSMQETVYPTLASNLGSYFASGEAPRTANKHGGLAIAPYNVYRASDGHVAVIVITEQHWAGLLKAMGRGDLADDPRLSTNAARSRNMAVVDELVEAWTATLTRSEVFETARAHGVPVAPVRDLGEVVNDPHMHERGMLHWVDHPEVGRVVLHASPLRFHGMAPVAYRTSPPKGADNRAVYVDWLGLAEGEYRQLVDDKVI